MRLIVADDSDVLRSSLIDNVSEIERIEVLGEAKSSEEVIKSVKELRPDVVILDIRLEKGNSFSALEEIKKIKDPPLVIMFTNYPYLQYRKKCLDAGADFFFYKAVDFKKLIDLLRDLALDK